MSTKNNQREKEHMSTKALTCHDNPFVRNVLFAGGFVCTGLGIIGIFLPLMPTTVFLIMAAYCFAKSSPFFHDWLLHHPILGKYICSYLKGEGMPLRAKIISISLLAVTIGFSIFIVEKWIIKIIIFLIGVCVALYIASIKSKHQV